MTDTHSKCVIKNITDKKRGEDYRPGDQTSTLENYDFNWRIISIRPNFLARIKLIFRLLFRKKIEISSLNDQPIERW